MDKYLKTLLDSFGEALKEDAVITEYNAAREEYLHDVKITAAVNEYNVQNQLLVEQQSKEDKDEALIASIEKRTAELYDLILANESMKRLSKAEIALNNLINEVNETLISYVSPESSCSGSCSTCGGCH